MSLKKASKLVAYLTLAVVAIASGVLVARHFKPKRTKHKSGIVGTRFPRDLEWEKSGETLVLVLQVGCKYCSESTGFYQHLLSQSLEKHMRVIAIMPNEVREAQEYLRASQMRVSEVQQVEISRLGIRGTPTVLLVDKTGTVKKAWEGKLSPSKEQEVLNVLPSNSDMRSPTTDSP